MKKDIEFPKVQNVSVAVVQKPDAEGDGFDWVVYLLNNNDFPLANVLVASKGYGLLENGEQQKTGVLRHMIQTVAPHDYAIIERIDPQVFHLTNEYFVTYYEGNFGTKIYDKKFLFVPESIVEENLSYIPQIELKGILHD
ncbi:MAG: hypothetical protein V4543_05585 [Bacteroidota bacterium]